MNRNRPALLALLLFPATLVFIVAQTAFAQTAEISGTISMPAAKAAPRVSRGDLYRNRMSAPAHSEMDMKQEPVKSAFGDVIISLHPVSYKAKTTPLADAPKIGQKNAAFVPRVTVVTPNSVVQFINDDPFFHNVFSRTPGNTFSIGRRPTGDVVSKKIGEQRIVGAGEIKLFCDIHTQMSAVILSLDTPYFMRASASGLYSFKNIPDGTYELRVYHPDLGTTMEKVELKSGQSVQKNMTLAN
ncbi:MAG: hypothetical protein IAF08_12770 [Rhizobacter sp.]|nr:hypothetical protein [Chlorobiales bacterium]